MAKKRLVFGNLCFISSLRMNQKWLLHVIAVTSFAAFVVFGLACASSPQGSPGGTVRQEVYWPDELDTVIREASDYLNDNIPKGSKIVILNIQSSSTALSEYIIDELIANAVNDRVFTVVDRQQLDTIRVEQNFQFSGEVDDNDALAIGRFFGAQTIVSGAVSELGDRYRMRIRALEVQTAQVQGQYNRNIAPGWTISALMGKVAAPPLGTQSASVRTSGVGISETTGTTVNLGAFTLVLEDGFQYDTNYAAHITNTNLLRGHKIVAGETYLLKITYSASRDLEDGIVINFVDTTEKAKWWTLLTYPASFPDANGKMPSAQLPASKAGEIVSATITLVTIADATSNASSANALVFRTFGEGTVGKQGSGIKKAVTLSFTEFVLTRL